VLFLCKRQTPKTASTKETSFSSDKRFAEDWYNQLRFDEKHGIPIHGRKFRDVVGEYIEYQETLIGGNELTTRQTPLHNSTKIGLNLISPQTNYGSYRSQILSKSIM